MAILRVWALYSRSRIILGVLLALYSIEIILFVVDRVVFSTEKNEGTWNSVTHHADCITGCTPIPQTYSGHHAGA